MCPSPRDTPGGYRVVNSTGRGCRRARPRRPYHLCRQAEAIYEQRQLERAMQRWSRWRNGMTAAYSGERPRFESRWGHGRRLLCSSQQSSSQQKAPQPRLLSLFGGWSRVQLGQLGSRRRTPIRPFVISSLPLRLLVPAEVVTAEGAFCLHRAVSTTRRLGGIVTTLSRPIAPSRTRWCRRPAFSHH